MSTDTQSILCGSCRVPIQGPADGQDDSMFSCPSCGRSDTREGVLKEAKAFVTDLARRSVQDSMRKAARGSKMLQYKGKPIPKKTYRFITDHKF